MRKKISILLAGLIGLGMVTGCSKTVNSGFEGTYWLEAPSVSDVENGFYEKTRYNVSSIENDDYAPKLYEINDNYLNFFVDEAKSSYETELEAVNGYYVYKTKLVIYGKYVYGTDGVYEVEGDVTETETVFKGKKDGFACVKSVKKVKNTYPVEQAPATADDFVTVGAEFTIDYAEKNATLTAKGADERSAKLLSALSEPVKIKKYNKKAYMDNELMLLLFRNFRYENTLTYTFSTIEWSTGALKEIIGSAKLDTVASSSDANKTSAIKSMVVSCNIDNVRKERSFNTFGVTFKTTGEFAQSFAHVFYANSIGDDVADLDNNSRHYMVKCYTPAIYNVGYIVYTLDTVSHTK